MSDSPTKPPAIETKHHYEYDGFISYSHKADSHLAEALERQLEKFAKPWFRRRGANIFRDETSLSAEPKLWEGITRRMDKSAYLILLASSSAAESKWVRKEICYWITGGKCDDPDKLQPALIDPYRIEHLLVVLSDGNIAWDDAARDFDWSVTTALPRAVIERSFPAEPLWVDLSWVRANPARRLDRTNEEFMRAVARLSSPMRNLDIEALIGEDYREYRKTINLFRGLAAGLLVLFLLALLAAWIAYGQWNEAEHRLGEVRLQNGRRTIMSDGDPSGGLLWLAEALQSPGTRSEPTRNSARLLTGAWNHSLPCFSLLHEEPVTMGAWSPDGSTIATATGKTLWLWDAETGNPRCPPIPHEGDLSAVVFSPDGKTIGTATSDLFVHRGAAQLWEATTGKQRLKLTKEESAEIYAIAFSPDGSLFVIAGVNGTQRFDVATGAAIGKPLHQRGEPFLISFSPEGGTLVTGSYGPRGEADGDVRVWETKSGAARGEPVEHTEWLTGIVFAPDGKRFATLYQNGHVRIWDAETGLPQGEPLDCGRPISLLAFSHDGTQFVTVDDKGKIHRWDAKSHKALRNEFDYEGVLDRIEFTPDDKMINLSGPDGMTRLNPFSHGVQVLYHCRNRGAFVAYNSDRSKILTASGDRVARVWDVSTYHAGSAPLQHDESVTVLAYSPKGMLIAGGGSKGTTILWDLQSQNRTKKSLKNASSVLALVFSRDGKKIYTADRSTFFRWDSLTGADEKEMNFESYFFDDVALSAEYELAATAYLDVPQGGFEPPEGDLYLWTMGHKEPALVANATAEIKAVAFSPDGALIASAWKDNAVRLSQVRSKDKAPAVLPHPSPVDAIAFQPNGALLATASGSIIQFWKVETRAVIGDRIVLDANARNMLFSPDGRILAVVVAGRVQLWDVESRSRLGEPIQHPFEIQAVAFRNDGRELAIGSDRVISRLPMPTKETGTPQRVVLSVEVRTAMTIREGVIRTLTARELAEKKSALSQLGGDCFHAPDAVSANRR